MLQEDQVNHADLLPKQSDLDNINLNDWYRRSEAAARLGCTEKYVHKLATEQHKFAYYKLSPHLMLYWKKGVDAFKVQDGPGRPKGSGKAAKAGKA